MIYGDYAVATLVYGPGYKFPMIMNPKKGPELYWKFPGGRSEEGETPEETAIREVYEETGLIIKIDQIALLFKKDRNNHTFYFFIARTYSLSTLLKQGETGEYVRLFNEEEILSRQKFFPSHRKLLEQMRIKYP